MSGNSFSNPCMDHDNFVNRLVKPWLSGFFGLSFLICIIFLISLTSLKYFRNILAKVYLDPLSSLLPFWLCFMLEKKKKDTEPRQFLMRLWNHQLIITCQFIQLCFRISPFFVFYGFSYSKKEKEGKWKHWENMSSDRSIWKTIPHNFLLLKDKHEKK